MIRELLLEAEQSVNSLLKRDFKFQESPSRRGFVMRDGTYLNLPISTEHSDIAVDIFFKLGRQLSDSCLYLPNFMLESGAVRFGGVQSGYASMTRSVRSLTNQQKRAIKDLLLTYGVKEASLDILSQQNTSVFSFVGDPFSSEARRFWL